MDFRVLGPIEAWHGGQQLDLGSRKQRTLLAILLLRANQVVSSDALIDGLWGERAPPTAAHTLQVYVSRLRGVLRQDGVVDDVLVTRPPGYMLRVEFGDLDLARFEQLADDGRRALAAGSFARAAEKLRDALAVWRGPALSDLAYEPFAQLEVERLEARRLAVVEDRVEAELELGRQAALVPELQALVAQHPLRERLRAQLMLALYRSGRQADALATYRDARDHLVGELGLEPGKELRALEQAVVQQDEVLELRRSEDDVTAGPPRDASGWSQPRGRRWILAGALAVIGVAVGTALVLVQDGGRSSERDARRTSRLHAIDSRSGAALVAADLPGSPADVASGMGSVWLAEPDAGRITRIDPRSGTATDRIQVPDQPGHLTVGGGAVWVASALSDRITRIDPKSDMVTQTIRFGGVRASDLAFAAGGVWVADSGVHGLTEIDSTTGAVRRRLGLEVAPAAIAVDQDTIWVASYEAGVVEQLDRRSGDVINTIPVGQGPGAIAVARDAVWVANSLDATVSRIDPATGSVRATIPVPSAPSALAALPSSVWVASPDAGVVTDLDPRRNAIVSSHRLGGRPQALAAAGAPHLDRFGGERRVAPRRHAYAGSNREIRVDRPGVRSRERSPVHPAGVRHPRHLSSERRHCRVASAS